MFQALYTPRGDILCHKCAAVISDVWRRPCRACKTEVAQLDVHVSSESAITRGHATRLVSNNMTDLEITISIQQKIRWFEIAMEDIGRMQRLQGS